MTNRTHRPEALALLPLLLALGCADVPAAPAARTEPASAAAAPTAPPATPAATRESLALDPAASTVGFVGAKVTREHEGGFRAVEGRIELAPEALASSSLEVTVRTESLFADDPDLIGHLKSPDFFDVARFPTASFRSTALVAGATPGAFDVTGDLTMHGVTKRVTFPATVTVEPGKVSARAEFRIDRRDFGIVYPGMANDLIRDAVVLRIALVANRPAR